MSNASASDIKLSDEIDHKDNFPGGEDYWHERLEHEITLMMVPSSRRGKGLGGAE